MIVKNDGKCINCGCNTDINKRTKKPYWRCIKCREKENQRMKKSMLGSSDLHNRRKKRSKQWYLDNKNRALKEARERWNKLREKIFDTYGKICNCCGETETKFLTLDHINEDGKTDRKIMGKYAVYKDAIKNYQPERFQILCWNCNITKHNYGTCPHKGLSMSDK